MGQVIHIYRQDRSRQSQGYLGKTVLKFPRVSERSRGRITKIAITRSEKFEEMDKQRESICDHSQEAQDHFQKQSDIWKMNRRQASPTALQNKERTGHE